MGFEKITWPWCNIRENTTNRRERDAYGASFVCSTSLKSFTDHQVRERETMDCFSRPIRFLLSLSLPLSVSISLFLSISLSPSLCYKFLYMLLTWLFLRPFGLFPSFSPSIQYPQSSLALFLKISSSLPIFLRLISLSPLSLS